MKDITYTVSQMYSSKDKIWWAVYYFYPDDEWDEDKLQLEEALERYPKTEYNWVLVGEDV